MKRLSQSQINERNREFAAGRVFCIDCNAFKPVSEFYPCKGNSNFGYRFYCKKCEYDRRDKIKARSRYLKIRTGNVDKLVEMLGGKCQFPGCEYDNPLVLEFHHINPDEKGGSPKAMTYAKSGFNKAIDEANKCCLLCPNHHREFEAGLYQVEFEKVELGYMIASVTTLDNRIIKKNGVGNMDTYTPPPVVTYRETTIQPKLW